MILPDFILCPPKDRVYLLVTLLLHLVAGTIFLCYELAITIFRGGHAIKDTINVLDSYRSEHRRILQGIAAVIAPMMYPRFWLRKAEFLYDIPELPVALCLQEVELNTVRMSGLSFRHSQSTKVESFPPLQATAGFLKRWIFLAISICVSANFSAKGRLIILATAGINDLTVTLTAYSPYSG